MHGYEEYANIHRYWGYNKGQLGQLLQWKYFQRFQKRKRKNMEIFAHYQQDICKYRQDESIEGDIILCFDPTKQTKVDEWKEYHYFQHRRLIRKKALAEESRQRREVEKQEWEEAEKAGKYKPMCWIYKDKTESLLDDHLFFLGWIEQQLPEIARENAAPNHEPQNTLDFMGTGELVFPVPENETYNYDTFLLGLNESQTRNKNPTNPVLGLSDAPKVNKNCRRTKKSSRLQTPIEPVASNTGNYGASQISKDSVAASAATATSQFSANTAAPLRRSQRLRNLEIKRK